MENIKDHDETAITTTLAPEIPDDSGHYIFIPLAVLFGILALSALVYLMAKNRRRLAHIYFKRKSSARTKYNEQRDDDSDVALLQGELDDPTECLLKGKLEIDTRSKYQTTEVVKNIPDEHLYEFFT